MINIEKLFNQLNDSQLFKDHNIEISYIKYTNGIRITTTLNTGVLRYSDHIIVANRHTNNKFYLMPMIRTLIHRVLS